VNSQAEAEMIATAERLGCPVVMVDDRPIPPGARVSALMTQATVFADTINREAGRTVATVERRCPGAPVWVRIGRRAYDVAELRALLLREGQLGRFVARLLAENPAP
jgi:hypothetical protein